MAVGTPAAALVECECRGDELGAVLCQPIGTVEGFGGLLAAGQRQFDAAFGTVAALLEAHQHIDPGGIQRLHVGGSAAKEIAVFLDQDEGIAGPILALGLDHIEVAQQQQRLR